MRSGLGSCWWAGGRSRTLLREDACQVRGVGAQVLAALRALVVSLLHREGIRQKKAALEAFSFHPLSALRFLGLYAVQRSSLSNVLTKLHSRGSRGILKKK